MTAREGTVQPQGQMPTEGMTRAEAMASDLSLKTYIDLRIVELLTDVRARREGMAAEEATHRMEHGSEEDTYRAAHKEEHTRLAEMVGQARVMADDLILTAFTDHQREHRHVEAKIDETMAAHVEEVKTWRAALALELTAIRTMSTQGITNLAERMEREREIGMSLFTTYTTAHDSVHETVNERIAGEINNRRDALILALSNHEREHQREHEADLLANNKLDTRLEGMNELRAQIDRSAQLYPTRDQLDDKIEAVMARVEASITNSAGGVVRVEGTLSAQVQRLEGAIAAQSLSSGEEIRSLRESRANSQGRNTALMAVWGIGIVILSLGITIIFHFLK